MGHCISRKNNRKEYARFRYRQQQRKSIKTAELRWKNHLQPFFTKLRADNLDTDMVQRYCNARETEGASGPTINRELAVLKRAFYLAMRKRTPPKVQRVPIMPSYKESEARTGFLEDVQYAPLARECSKEGGLWLRALLTVAYSFGFRKGELLSLRVRQVDLLDRTIRLEGRMTKNGRPRIAPMTDEVATLLTACVLGKEPDDFVFTRPNGKPVKNFGKIWKTVCTRAGVPDLLFHDLRRTGVRNLLRVGVQQKVAQDISGHKTASVFQRYNIVNEVDIREAGRLLNEKQKSNAPEFGQTLGIVAKNCSKNEAVTQQKFAAAVLPN